jgi:hypothetical protein
MMVVKVFSATKARDREELGDKITKYMATALAAGAKCIDKQVLQSSDAEFHCLSITLFLEVPDSA